MSSGGKLQLAFRGPQDAYISGQPQMTFFKALYKRYTNFAKECVWLPFDGNPKQGGKSTAIIDRQGDLVQEMFITADLPVTDAQTIDPDFGFLACYTIEKIINSVSLYIGHQQIDKHYALWWRLYSELCRDDAKKAQYSKMTSADSAGTCRIYLPLIFFFNRNPGLALPLISIPNQQVRVEFDWSNSNGGYLWTNPLPIGPGIPIPPVMSAPSIKCWANYIYLDQAEREVMSTKEQTYLIDQVQYSGREPIPATSAVSTPGATPSGPTFRVPLNFKHPVKELVWCFPFYEDWGAITTAGTIIGTSPVVSGATQTEPHLSGGTVRLIQGATSSETADGPLASMHIEINKSKVAEEQGGKYYNSIQPFKNHSGCPTPGLYNFSFALDPESIKPTGSCNFSRIEDAACFIRLNTGAASFPPNLNMQMYATNFNVLDIKKGFASLAFSS